MSEGARNWRCPKCGSSYKSPVKVKSVQCPTCTRSVNVRGAVLMSAVSAPTKDTP